MIIKIDGKNCECEKGEFLLQVAKRNGIYIPTLCHHDSLPGQAACRVCLVEVIESNGASQVVASCVFPIDHEIEVNTQSPRVYRERAMVLALLKLRAPESDTIAAMAKYYDAPDLSSRLKISEPGKCIMCGLCVKACTELSVGAISTVNRGVTKMIATPYHEPSTVCVGCKSCAGVCPTGAIEVTEDNECRTIWGRTFELVHCARCGAVIGTKEEIETSAKRAGHEPETLCAECRKKAIAETFAHTFGVE